MKYSRILIIIATAYLATGCGGGDNSNPKTKNKNIDSDLLAYYPFNGNANDESVNSNNGVVDGATLTTDRSGSPDSAYIFNGLSDSISIPVNINPSALPKVTMTAWVRADSEDPIRQVISHDNAGFDRSLGIDFRGGGNGWSAFSGTGGVLGFQPVIIGEWVFLAVVYDQAAGNIKLYVNDIMMEKQGMLNEGLNTLLIGSNPAFGEYFSGAIDEVRIYSRTLTTSETQEIFNL